MKKKVTLLMLSFLYLLIEIQAWVFISKLYREETTSTSLSQYELFGYASAGLGITLLGIKYIANQKIKNKNILLSVLITAPLLYLSSVWAIYETVNLSDELIPESKKGRALNASLLTLSSPSWSNLSSFYIGTPKSETDSLINSFQSLHPTSDRLIQYTYIVGINTLRSYSMQYKDAAEMIDKDFWPILWKKSRSLAMVKYGGEIKLQSLENEFSNLQNFTGVSRYTPSNWLSLGTTYYLLSKEEASPLKSFEFFKKDSFKTLYEYKQNKTDVLAWALIGESFEHWPNFENEVNDEVFRHALSQAVFGEHINLPNEAIPWYTNEEDILRSDVFLKSAAQITPFFFDSDGKPMISASEIINHKTKQKYIKKLQNNLPTELREYWFAFQSNLFKELIKDQDKWKETASAALAEPILRVGTVTPFMLILSSLLIIINVADIWKRAPLIAISAIAMGCLLYNNQIPEVSQFMLEGLNKISVQEPAIYLRP